MGLKPGFTYAIISLGCSKNEVDSERLNGALSLSGFIFTPEPADADVIFINTCGFITPAKEESIETIFETRERYPDSVLAVFGCLVKRYFNDIQAEIPEIDFLYGLYDDEMTRVFCGKFSLNTAVSILRERRPLEAGRVFSYLKIAEGCSNNCSYCAIPGIRGPYLSIEPERIISDAERAVSGGAKELVLVSQDTALYRYGKVDLFGLVSVLDTIEGVSWIRVLYSHPGHINESFLRIYELHSVCRYIDMPLQHVNGSILRSMGREGDYASCLALVQRLREKVPEIRIRTTFMIGYPGEDGKAFNELMKFVEQAELDRVGCFIYSPEEGTPAAGLADSCSKRTKNARYREIMELQARISSQKLARMKGGTVEVIIEQKAGDGLYACRTQYDAPEVDGIFYLTARDAEINSIVSAKVTGSDEYDLFGELI